MPAIGQALREAGLLPADCAFPDAEFSSAPGADLLEPLLAYWQQRGGRMTQGEHERRQRLQRWVARGGCLTRGLPGPSAEIFRSWLGERLLWWPQGVPDGRRVGLASSRLGHGLDRRRSWFDTLRTACLNLEPARDRLLVVRSTSSERFVRRCSQLFHVPRLEVRCASAKDHSLAAWMRRVSRASKDTTSQTPTVWISPALEVDGDWARHVDDLPLADRAMATISDRILALHVRAGGHLDRLLTLRLDDFPIPPATVYVAIHPELVAMEMADAFMQQGAIGWYLHGRDGKSTVPIGAAFSAGRSPSASTQLAPIANLRPCQYLTHCTRRRRGPWPDEDENHFLDDLILDRAGADHSAFAALWRIIRLRRLCATADMIRGRNPVISFTAATLSELTQLRQYRSHLGRWDFERYGICIRRDWLQRRGTRAVIYGDETTWKSLADADKPFFQVSCSNTPAGQTMDWTLEREWRHMGDLRLERVPADAAWVFVPTAEEAGPLAAISPWPVVVCQPGNDSLDPPSSRHGS